MTSLLELSYFHWLVQNNERLWSINHQKKLNYVRNMQKRNGCRYSFKIKFKIMTLPVHDIYIDWDEWCEFVNSVIIKIKPTKARKKALEAITMPAIIGSHFHHPCASTTRQMQPLTTNASNPYSHFKPQPHAYRNCNFPLNDLLRPRPMPVNI